MFLLASRRDVPINPSVTAAPILMVEDDPQLGAQAETRLRDSGYATTWWREGRLLLKEQWPAVELVVLDLMLPGTYGVDLTKRVFDAHGMWLRMSAPEAGGLQVEIEDACS